MEFDQKYGAEKQEDKQIQFDPAKLHQVFKEMAEMDENPNSEKA